MRPGHGLLTLLVRLVSGRLLHDVGAFAKREVRLIVVAVIGFIVSLAFVLGATAIAIVSAYTVLAPHFGALQSLGILIAATLVVAIIALAIAMKAARAFTHWEAVRLGQPVAKLT